ncbi:hypothetical protein SUGI_0789700 [Cryptomeria japonica]|uniref:3-ketoacyl-CoA synthase 13 n=1 Tax=Cryptomeria japonica TaxID=3369 RepID=UPI0024147E72|nr:3-ketoacyl-CoA synthase 13 [Cryptomeria japonica]GLJ38735.1 hypothetical protein SUGI_0789700 [Cryptomeria japonica]
MARSSASIIGLSYVLLVGAYIWKDSAWEVYDLAVGDHSLFVRRAAETIMVGCVVVAWTLYLGKKRRQRECYLVDYSCYRVPEDRKMNAETSIYFSCNYQPLVAEHLGLQWKVFLRSGLGDETGASHFLFNGRGEATLPEARLEMRESFTVVLDELFAKTRIHPQQIDILIVTVSTFTPAPSHASWIVHHYNMKESVKTFNLSGMGCSANVIGVDMAKDLFRLYPDSYALVVGTECITVNANYQGSDKSMMLTNCLFRVGGYAVLLSNNTREAERAKMRLRHVVRTIVGADDESYGCVMGKEDADGFYGISLRHSLIQVAGNAVRRNLATLGPKVLPLREMLYYAFNTVCIKLFKMKVEPYIPNFRLAFQHFCIHPGGRAVVNGMGKNLRLADFDLEPSRMALHRFGNTSTSGLWYEVAYMEAKGRLKAGHRLLHIALGSGFKCNTAVWEVMRESRPGEMDFNVWNDCIHRYPCNTRHRFTDDYCQVYFDAFRSATVA